VVHIRYIVLSDYTSAANFINTETQTKEPNSLYIQHSNGGFLCFFPLHIIKL